MMMMTEPFKGKISSSCEMSLGVRGLHSLSVLVWQSSLAVSGAAGTLFPQLSVTALICSVLLLDFWGNKLENAASTASQAWLVSVHCQAATATASLFVLPLCLPSSLQDL